MQASMSRTKETVLAVVVLTALAVGLVVAGVLPSQADPEPIHSEELTAAGRGVFTDDVSMQIKRKLDGRRSETFNLSDPSQVANTRITIQPGAQFPWHTHPGPVIVTVTEGLLVYVQADDCVRRPYQGGTSFVDPGNSVHTAYTPTTNAGETVLIVTLLDVPAGAPLMTPAEQQGELDARCGIDVAASHEHG